MKFEAQAVRQERFILNSRLTPTQSEKIGGKKLASKISTVAPAFIAFINELRMLKQPTVVEGY